MPNRKLLLASLIVFSICATATDRYHLVRILVRGSQRYSEAELVRAIGLVPDSQVTVDDLKNAAGRIGNSGVFSSVQYLYKPVVGANAIEADFDVTDAPQFLPAKFDNFVWFSPEELDTELRKALPLYNGSLPMSGTMSDDLSAALARMLTARKLPSEVSYGLQAEIGKPPSAYLYKIENSNLKIVGFNFEGGGHVEPALLLKSVAPLKGGDYLYSNIEGFLKFNLIPLYRQRGYLKAAVAAIKPHAKEDGSVDVDVSVNEGGQYRLAAYQWADNTLITSGELSTHISLKPGEPVNEVKLGEDLAAVRKMFGKFGYEAATVTPVPSFGDGTVNYSFQVTEGDLYRMGALEVIAPEPARGRTISAWKLKEGAPYDNTYIKEIAGQLAKIVPDKAYQWKATERIDDAKKVVNVRLEVKVR
jgi:outer membrane protein assembly factor BamA